VSPISIAQTIQTNNTPDNNTLPLPQSAVTRVSIWAWSRSTLVLPLGFLKLNPVIVRLLLVVPRVPVKECDDPFFSGGEVAGMFIDLNPRSTVVDLLNVFFPFFRHSEDMYAVFAAIVGGDPC
jgi:hypothetical protein